MTRPRVSTGVDRILGSPSDFPRLFEVGSTVGLVTSEGAPTRFSPDLSTRQALLKAGTPLVHLFTPEHGISAGLPDGAPVADARDPTTGLPVTSLYGPRIAPPPQRLADLDLVLFDLQDVGARFYTFLWTLSHVMEACAEARTPLWILDRPNPLGGLPEWVEGPMPDPHSHPHFLGRWPLPVRHSLTLGEMGLLLREEMALDLELNVVPMEGWRREHLWPSTGLDFHPPSPGIATFQSALLYPGLAFLEATNLHEGRGTERSFRWFGAPWLDPEEATKALESAGLQGVRAHPHEQIQDGKPCPGVYLQVTEPEALRPVSLGLRLLAILGTLWPDDLQWSPYPTAANPQGRDHLFRLTGSHAVVSALEGDPSLVTEEDLARWTGASDWWGRAEPHLLYH